MPTLLPVYVTVLPSMTLWQLSVSGGVREVLGSDRVKFFLWHLKLPHHVTADHVLGLQMLLFVEALLLWKKTMMSITSDNLMELTKCNNIRVLVFTQGELEIYL